jgi:type III pantothenate kinase
MTNRILTVDVGNSRINFGLFEDGELAISDFVPTAPENVLKIIGFIAEWKGQEPFEQIVLSSVVPKVGDMLVSEIQTSLHFPVIVVNEFKTKLMPLLVDEPKTVGVDRVVNCFGVMKLYGTPAIVISMGTATTFEVVSEQGEYLGGCIVPGVRISLEALSKRTALLPPGIWEKPENIIAKNTEDHMKAGIYYGTLSLIEGMVSRYKEALHADAKVIATGGISTVLKDEKVFDIHDPFLILKGLKEVAAWTSTH